MSDVATLADTARIERERQDALRDRIMCCTVAGCLSAGAQRVRDAVQQEIESRNLGGEVEVRGTGCLGLCSRAPLVRSAALDAVLADVTPDDAPALVAGDRAHFDGRLLDERHPFYAGQRRLVLGNSGYADPERIVEYIARGGYRALLHAVNDMTPADLLAEVKRSTLRGRGGAGYPTGLKWELVARQPSPVKYVVCNADEGDPGAFMNRSVLEGDPHRVLEGMAIAGRAVGARRGFVYVRGESPLAIDRVRTALEQAERAGFLGSRIDGSDFQFHIDLRVGGGAYVCGEETALIASIEGGRGQPKPRPPYPPERGLWDHPTLINNVETFADIPWIVEHGGEAFAAIGTPASPGTKVFALAGRIVNAGLVEVPIGTSLRTLIFDLGSGVPVGREFKAAQTGGPAGGCIPAADLDTPMDYDSLSKLGTIMGSGGLIVMDSTTCMVDIARFFMEFCRDESCGKCVPCRAGTAQMHQILERITHGDGIPDDLALLRQLGTLLADASLCGLGMAAPNPVISTLRHFAAEYEAHILERRCPAGSCTMPEASTAEHLEVAR